MGSHCRRTYVDLARFRLFRLRPRRRVPCCKGPYFLLQSFLRHHPVTVRIPIYCLSTTVRLRSSIYGYRSVPVCGKSYHPSEPFLFNCNSTKPSFRAYRSIRTDPHKRFLFQSFRPVRLSAPRQGLPILFRFIKLFPRLFLERFLLYRLR